MRDGTIVEDESTTIGAVAKGALKTYLRKRKTTEEDIIAGVSALLKDVPGVAIGGLSHTRPSKRSRRGRARKAKH